jgi:hypothetical protein
MSIPADADHELLIAHFSGPLSPPDRPAFRRAAEVALSQISGEGAAYRVVATLWRQFFNPPDDRRAGWDISRELGGLCASRLANGPPVGADDPRAGARDRKRLRLVG